MEKKQQAGIFFERLDRMGRPVKYPAWRYHKILEPKIVNDTEEDQQAYLDGWKDPSVPVTAHQGFSNFYHDLEDMNCRQLVYYAREEFGAELPEEAGKARLLHAIWQIATRHPKSRNRIVLLAQSIRMNLDETHAEILKMAGNMEDCDKITKEEVWV
jgi:hypothetical protein